MNLLPVMLGDIAGDLPRTGAVAPGGVYRFRVVATTAAKANLGAAAVRRFVRETNGAIGPVGPNGVGIYLVTLQGFPRDEWNARGGSLGDLLRAVIEATADPATDVRATLVSAASGRSALENLGVGIVAAEQQAGTVGQAAAGSAIDAAAAAASEAADVATWAALGLLALGVGYLLLQAGAAKAVL